MSSIFAFSLCPSCPLFALSIIFIFKSATWSCMPTDLGDKDAMNLSAHTYTHITHLHGVTVLINTIHIFQILYKYDEKKQREINKRKILTNQPHTITLSLHSLLAAPRCRILRGWLWICHPHTKTQGRQLSAQAVAVAPVWVTGASLLRRLDVSIRLKQMWPFINMRSISVYPQQDGFDIILLYLTLSLLICCCHSLSFLSLPLSPSLPPSFSPSVMPRRVSLMKFH